jgi:hypothetical protein
VPIAEETTLGFTPGANDEEDGAVGGTRSAARSGLVGRNDSGQDAAAPGGSGVFGFTSSGKAAGVFGANNHTETGSGVHGNGAEAGVSGFSERGAGILGHGNNAEGVTGFTESAGRNAVFGRNNAKSEGQGGGPPVGNGVFGYTEVPNGSGVVGAVGAGNTKGAGVTGLGKVAGRFFGDVVVTGDIQLTGADCAEEFEVTSELAEPGTVMVVGDSGGVGPSEGPCDARVVGVVPGAGEFRPGIVLDSRGEAAGPRQPIALMGKVFCKVDATDRPVRVGDLLTTAAAPGHAMPLPRGDRGIGAVLGKALGGLEGGRGMVPILVMLG